MVYYLFLFAILVFCLFLLGYRIDISIPSDYMILRKIKLNKSTAKFFFYNNRKVGILNAAFFLQCLGYLLIPTAIIVTSVFISKGYNENVEFNRYFGIVIFSTFGVLTLYFIAVLILSKIINRRK